MTLSEAIALLRTDLGDQAGELLSDNDLLRALTRASSELNSWSSPSSVDLRV